MGPRLPSASGIVLSRGVGSNLFDSDGNRYVDLAGGFGALLLGHSHPDVVAAIQDQSTLLTQALGDLYPSEKKIALLERVTAFYPGEARGILGQSGSDAVSGALKTAMLHTGRPGVIAFSGSYHGLGYGPLAALDLRQSYREPFRTQLNQHVRFVPYPVTEADADSTLQDLHQALALGDSGAILIEPILGRGGVVVPPKGFLAELQDAAHRAGALLIADEIWTGLGRSGRLLYSCEEALPDLVCLGKGLGGGVPLSAVIGRAEVMQSWSREHEVVHTSTFAGNPLVCAAAIATLDALSREELADRARSLGERFRGELTQALDGHSLRISVRGAGLMIGIELSGRAGAGAALQRALLERGYVASTGGGTRDVLVLTPALNIAEPLLLAFIPALLESLEALG